MTATGSLTGTHTMVRERDANGVTSREAAHAAAERIHEMPACLRFFSLIKDDFPVEYGEVVSDPIAWRGRSSTTGATPAWCRSARWLGPTNGPVAPRAADVDARPLLEPFATRPWIGGP
jgi:hypothetical protein